MSHLETFVQMLKEAGAEQIRLAPGKRASALIDGEIRDLGSDPIDSRTIVAAATELLPLSALDGARNGHPRIVRHSHANENFLVEVARDADGVTLAIRSASRSAAPTTEVIFPEIVPPKRRRMRSRGASPSPPAVVSTGAISIRPSPFAMAPKPRAPSRPMEDLLREMLARGASDLHLSAGSHPAVRVRGELQFLRHRAVLNSISVLELVREITSDDAAHEFAERNEVCFAYTLRSSARFRVHLFEDRQGVCAALRHIPLEVVPFDGLGLPERTADLLALTQGLLVIGGPVGSGKTTTVASMIDCINRTRAAHIVTIEDPVEFVFTNAKSLVNQRKLSPAATMAKTVRAALRDTPDVLFLSELREPDSIVAALDAADAGPLVVTTVSAPTTEAVFGKLVEPFPTSRQEGIARRLGVHLKAVFAQVLCPKLGGGRVAAYELAVSPSLFSSQRRSAPSSPRPTTSAEGGRSLNASLRLLVERGLVGAQEAIARSTDPGALRDLLPGVAPAAKSRGKKR